MHCTWFAAHPVYILAALSLLMGVPRAVTDDKAPPAKPTVEFRDFPGRPEDKVEYKFSLVVEVEGTDEKFESNDNGATGGFSAPALASFLGRQIKQAPGWKYSTKDDKLVVEGWTDPKTGKFHPVKAIRFESPNLPKDHFPTITLPRTKG